MKEIYGAIIGDIVGSRFEADNIKTKEFNLFSDECCFTDDSVMTIAVAKALYESKKNNYEDLTEQLLTWMHILGKSYPNAGYGGTFYYWLMENINEPYNSFGNGSAMRTSACGYIADSLDECLWLAKKCAEVSHNHEEGIKGAQAISGAIYLAKMGKSKDDIRRYISENFYELNFSLDEIRDSYKFDVTCQGSCPQAIEAFLESESFEDTIRNAISIGGDSDTIAAMAGSIAAVYYGVPNKLISNANEYLDIYLQTVVQNLG